MCRMTVNVDTKNKDIVSAALAEKGFTMSEAIRFYIDLMANDKAMQSKIIEMMEDAEDLRAAEEAEKRLTLGSVETYTLDEVRNHLGL